MPRPTQATTTLQQLTAGYTQTGDIYACHFCDETVEQGHIYPQGDDLVEAELAMKNHIARAHTSTFHALLAQGKKATGLSDIQRNLLGHFYDGRSDREIQPLAGDVSLSTIRNHRFVLREKARQAKVFLALMELLESRDLDPGSRFIQILERFDAAKKYTQSEVNEILATASEDYTTLCRYLVDYKFLGRTRDGSQYWVE